MYFPEISSRGGVVTTNFTSIQNILLSNCMSQDDVTNLDSMVEEAVETTYQEREKNKRKKQEKLKSSKKASNTERQQKYRNSIKNKRTVAFVKGKGCVVVCF